MRGSLHNQGGIILILGDHILLNVLERITDRIDRQSWCLVCKHFLYLEAICRKDLQVLRSEVLSRVLQRYSNLQHLDLSSCIQVTDEGLETVAKLSGLHLVSIKLIRAGGFTDVGLAALANKCLSLRDVDLTNCSRVGDSALIALSQLKNLQSLKLVSCRTITDTGLGRLATGCKGLWLLNLRGCFLITDKGIGFVAANCKQLHTLDLSYTELTVHGLSSVASLEHLEDLILVACNSVSDAGLACLKDGCRSLKSLDVSRCQNVTGVGIVTLAGSSIQLQQLTLSYCLQICDDLFPSFQKLRLLQGIKLDGCDISGPGLEFIGKGCKALKEFSVSKCHGITDTGIAALVAGCTGLHKLDLTCCRDLTDKTLAAIASTCKGLLSLKMEACGLISQLGLSWLCKECPCLEELDFTDSNIDDNGLKSIARCTALRFLKLGFCLNITDEGLAYIGGSCCNLRELDVYRSQNIGNAGVAAIASGCPRLRVMNLSYCRHVTDASMHSLAQLRDLVQLELRACVLVTSDGLSFLAASCKHLVELDIKRCSYIRDPGVLAVARGCPNLRQINLSYCAVTDIGLMAVAKLSCMQNMKLVHLKHVSNDCYAAALLACGSLKKVKLLAGLRMVLPAGVISQMESRGCRVRWMDKPS